MDVTPALLSAARHAGEVLHDARVGARWNEPSALAAMDVGTVAGHLFLVLRRVEKRLAGAMPTTPGPAGSYQALAVRSPEDLELEVHRAVRDDGSHVAAWGWTDVCAAYTDRLAKVAALLEGRRPGAVADGAGALALEEYLASRVVELTVHADDLAVSCGIDVVPPPDALEVALAFVLRLARRDQGDLAVLRAFTRRERVEAWMPSVY